MLRFIHCSGNKNEPDKTDENYDQLWKMRAILDKLINSYGDRSNTVVKVLGYKLEGRWFDSRWCHWIFH